MRKSNIKKPILLSLVSTSVLLGAQTPNISNIIKEVPSYNIEKKKKSLPSIEKKEDSKKVSNDDKKLFVKSFLLSGVESLDEKKLLNKIKAYENKKLSFNEIQDITNLITEEYKKNGYFIARAYIPVQNLKNQKNILKISIIEGNYGDLILENSSLVKDSKLQSVLNNVKEEEIISTNTLQRALLIINDTPGVIISGTKIKPGKEIGSSDFIITTDKTSRIDGYIIADNYSSEYTGEHRIMSGININSPFNIGDRLSFSALSSENTNLLNGRIAYNFPLNENGLRADISFSKTTYELGSTYEQLDALGYSNSIEAKISYPYIRTNNENLDTYLKTSYNEMVDKIDSTDTQLKKNTFTITAGIDYSKNSIIFNKYFESRINFDLTLGRLDFDKDEDKQNDENSVNTNGRFSKINLELNQNINLSDSIRWENSLQLQYALGDKNLDGSEDLSIGGINGVKLYPQGEQSAENGYIFNTELFYTLPSIKNLNSKISIFYDIAKVKMSENITNEDEITYQDAGIGYYAYYKDFFINSHLAYKVGNSEINSEEDYNSKFMFQAGWVF